MALEIDQETPFGLVIDGAYLRVDLVTILSKDNLRFALRSYQSKEAERFFDEEYFSCGYDINGENPYKQAYSYLKGLEKFQSATSV